MLINYLSKLVVQLCCFGQLHTINNCNDNSNQNKILILRAL